MIKTDLCIIGAGAAGLSLASAASQLGAKVVLVEAHRMGGECLNTGCVPSKALLAAAKHHWQCLNSPQFGFNITKATLDFHAVIAHVKRTIATLAPHDSVARFEKLGCQVLLGQGKFIDATTVTVKTTSIKATRFVLATGSSPFIPPILGLSNVPFYTNETIFDIGGLPKHLVVIGGGPIGCELAMAFSMLGANVTLIVRSQLLPKEAYDFTEVIRHSMKEKGIVLYENAMIDSTADLNQRLVVVIKHESKEKIITGSHLLIATGRTPNIQGLSLDKAKVEYNEKGIVVDTRLRTTNKKILAMGDVIGEPQLTPMANYQASIILKNCLFRLPVKVNKLHVPRVTYTVPELAQVGISSEEAKKSEGKMVITESTYEDNDRAQAESMTKGKIQVISDKKGRVLGVSIVGAQAGELIMPWLIMVKNKQSLLKMTNLIVPYPTLSELNKKVAAQFFQEKLFSVTMKKIVNCLKLKR